MEILRPIYIPKIPPFRGGIDHVIVRLTPGGASVDRSPSDSSVGNTVALPNSGSTGATPHTPSEEGGGREIVSSKRHEKPPQPFQNVPTTSPLDLPNVEAARKIPHQV